jgi:hypothetical protein
MILKRSNRPPLRFVIVSPNCMPAFAKKIEYHGQPADCVKQGRMSAHIETAVSWAQVLRPPLCRQLNGQISKLLDSRITNIDRRLLCINTM